MGRIIDTISSGDRVTIVDRFGKEHTGRAVMRSRDGGWVLNMGGPHGTPGLADDSNVVKVAKKKEKSQPQSAMAKLSINPLHESLQKIIDKKVASILNEEWRDAHNIDPYSNPETVGDLQDDRFALLQTEDEVSDACQMLGVPNRYQFLFVEIGDAEIVRAYGANALGLNVPVEQVYPVDPNSYDSNFYNDADSEDDSVY